MDLNFCIKNRSTLSLISYARAYLARYKTTDIRESIVGRESSNVVERGNNRSADFRVSISPRRAIAFYPSLLRGDFLRVPFRLPKSLLSFTTSSLSRFNPNRVSPNTRTLRFRGRDESKVYFYACCNYHGGCRESC